MIFGVLLAAALAAPVLPAAAKTTTVATSTSAAAGQAALSWLGSLLGRLTDFSSNSGLSSTTPIATSTIEALARGIPFIGKIKAFFDRVNRWFHDHLGIDFYELVRRLVGLAIVFARILIGLAVQALAWIEHIFKGL